jgi:hypothetical protein
MSADRVGEEDREGSPLRTARVLDPPEVEQVHVPLVLFDPEVHHS